MANWNALRWSEQVRTGAQASRHVLTMLCLKCDDNGVLYRDAEGVAELCEMSTRTLKTWRDNLDTQGLITVVRRMRLNGKEAKPLTLVNYPEAPHLAGEPIRLDYDGKHMFPIDPDGLRQRGLAWIAGEQPDATHPRAKPARGPRAKSARGTPSKNTHDAQVNPRAKPARGPRAKSAPHVGDGFCTPNAVPNEAMPNQTSDPATAEPTTSDANQARDDGWLDSSHEQEKNETDRDEPGSPQQQSAGGHANDALGARLLRSLRAGNGERLGAWAITKYATTIDGYLSAGHTAQQIAEHLASGMRGAGGIQSKLKKLADGTEQLPALAQAKPAMPPECGQCDVRHVENEHGLPLPCPRCNPKSKHYTGDTVTSGNAAASETVEPERPTAAQADAFMRRAQAAANAA